MPLISSARIKKLFRKKIIIKILITGNSNLITITSYHHPTIYHTQATPPPRFKIIIFNITTHIIILPLITIHHYNSSIYTIFIPLFIIKLFIMSQLLIEADNSNAFNAQRIQDALNALGFTFTVKADLTMYSSPAIIIEGAHMSTYIALITAICEHVLIISRFYYSA